MHVLLIERLIVMPVDMKAVMRFTKAGRLIEATKSIQKALTANKTTTPGEKSDERNLNASVRRSNPLGEVVGKLSELALKVARTTKTKKPNSPLNPQFQQGSFTCAAGTRSYKIYVPKSLPQQRRTLIVMLHGCSQNADDFAAGTRMNEIAELEGLLIVYPNQTVKANSSGCWNWFNPRDQAFGKGEPEIIAGLTSEIVAKFEVDHDRVFIAGLSAGGAMAVIMGHAYPNLYSAIGVHSGLPYQSAHDVISAFAAMRGDAKTAPSALTPRVIVFHGDADATVHPSNAYAIASAEKKCTAVSTINSSANGRNYKRITIENDNKLPISELWMIEGAGHAWSGGSVDGSFTDTTGPDASKEMARFFLMQKEMDNK